MKVYISDISALCCPEGVELGEHDMARTQRIKERVFEKLEIERPAPKRPGFKSVRTLVLAAVMVSLLTVSAFAAARKS